MAERVGEDGQTGRFDLPKDSVFRQFFGITYIEITDAVANHFEAEEREEKLEGLVASSPSLSTSSGSRLPQPQG